MTDLIAATAAIANLYQAIGARIAAARQQRGIRQADLATAVGLTRASITNIESGTQRIQLHTLIAAAQAIGVDPADLIRQALEGGAPLLPPLPGGQREAALLTRRLVTARTTSTPCCNTLSRSSRDRSRPRRRHLPRPVHLRRPARPQPGRARPYQPHPKDQHMINVHAILVGLFSVAHTPEQADHAAREVLQQHAHQLAEQLRTESARGRKSGLTRIYYRAAADLIDPQAHDDPLTVLRAIEETPGYRLVPGCPHCPDGHTPPDHGQTWGAYVGPDRDGDGQPTQIIVARSAGAHVAESDAEWIRARLNDTSDQL